METTVKHDETQFDALCRLAQHRYKLATRGKQICRSDRFARLLYADLLRENRRMSAELLLEMGL
jgi:hypothetical protein